MYRQPHFHSTTHEVLCCRAALCFGGKSNNGRVESTIKRGDVTIVPAGVGHRLLEDREGDFKMVGSYSKGCSLDYVLRERRRSAKGPSNREREAV